MKIGTDASIAECRAQGCGVIEFKVKNLFPNGRKAGLDKNSPVLFTQSNPDDWYDNGRVKFNADYYWNSGKGLIISREISWNEAWEIYLDNKEEIDSFADIKNCPFNEENPNEYDLLHLIDTVNAYKSIK